MEILPQPINRRLILFPNRSQVLSKYEVNPVISYFTYLPSTLLRETLSITDNFLNEVKFEYVEIPRLTGILRNKIIIYPNNNFLNLSYLVEGIEWSYKSKIYL